MATVQNIIRKQTVSFQYNGNADGFALQKEVSDWCKLMLIPEIEQQLELFDIGDNYINIDKLVVDAVIDKKDWQQKIRNELIFSLNQQLRDYKPAEKKIRDEQKNNSRSYKLDELILFYFEKGYLPWWSKAFVDSDFDTVLLKWIQEEKTQARADKIALKLQQIYIAPVIQRILNQVPGRLFVTFLKNIFKGEADTITEAGSFFNEVLKVNTTKGIEKVITKRLYEAILSMLITNKGSIDIELSAQVLRAIIKSETGITDKALQLQPVKSSLSSNRFVKAWQNMLTEVIKNNSEKDNETIKKESKHTYHRVIDQVTDRTTKNNMEEIAEDLREGIYIENGGAVIVAPFLPRLFETLKITGKAGITDPDLGILMIQYIVSGNTKIEEHELVLPKILCGINPEQPVNTTKKITGEQRAEADRMLKALIAHWSLIRDTSVEGLRESFLKRNGKLILVDDEWLLQVEQKAYDMVLQQLPWSISMIKLPWMKNILKTEWV